MIVIVGLGNPGEEYDKTRHNAGFLTIDILGNRWGANYWKDECGAQVAHIKNNSSISNRDDDEVVLVKPQSFMNLSGGPVKNILDKYKVPIENLIVIHDDLDILPCSIRVKRGGSSAGHNGLKSIENKIGTRDYLRIRVGIDHPPGQMPVVDYVLQCPKGKAEEDFNEAVQLASEAVEYYLHNDLEKTQQQFNSSK